MDIRVQFPNLTETRNECGRQSEILRELAESLDTLGFELSPAQQEAIELIRFGIAKREMTAILADLLIEGRFRL